MSEKDQYWSLLSGEARAELFGAEIRLVKMTPF